MAEYFAGGHLRFVNGEWRDDNGNAIEISRVRHGRWQGSSGDTCSVCGEECFDWSNMRAFLYPYCPYCNTKMDGVDDG